MLNKIIGIKEATDITKLSPGTIKNYCINGYITSKKINNTWVIDKTKLIAWLEMKVIFETINNNYEANGEHGKSVDFYHNKKHLLDEISEPLFEYKFNIKLRHLKFPIITFTNINSVFHRIFESHDERSYILSAAKDYFIQIRNKRVWEFRDYTVSEKEGLLKFVNNNGEVLGVISSDLPSKINELDLGADPIASGWKLNQSD